MMMCASYYIWVPGSSSGFQGSSIDQRAGSTEENATSTMSVLHQFHWFSRMRRNRQLQADEIVQFCEVCVILLSKLSSIKIIIIV